MIADDPSLLFGLFFPSIKEIQTPIQGKEELSTLIGRQVVLVVLREDMVNLWEDPVILAVGMTNH